MFTITLCGPLSIDIYYTNDVFMIYLAHQNLLYLTYPSRSASLSIPLFIIAMHTLCAPIAKQIIYNYIHYTYNKIILIIHWISFTALSYYDIMLLCASEIIWNAFHLCIEKSDAFIGTWKNRIHFIMLLYYDIVVFRMRQYGWMCREKSDVFFWHKEKIDTAHDLGKIGAIISIVYVYNYEINVNISSQNLRQ